MQSSYLAASDWLTATRGMRRRKLKNWERFKTSRPGETGDERISMVSKVTIRTNIIVFDIRLLIVFEWGADEICEIACKVFS